MKRKLLLAALFVVSALGFNAKAQEYLIYGGHKYFIVGENLIVNPSFENDFEGWTQANDLSTTITSSNFTIKKEDAKDGTNYLVGTRNVGAGDAASLGTAWSIEKNKTYVFSYWIKGEKDGTNTGYLISSLCKTKGNENYKLGKPVAKKGEWTKFEAVFHNRDYDYIQVKFRWLDGQWGFDNFFLAEVNEVVNDEVADPELESRQNFGGEDVTSYYYKEKQTYPTQNSDFTIEVDGVEGTEIQLKGIGVEYTPTKTGKVRFARKDNVIYVYEGSDYKGTIGQYTMTNEKELLADYNFENIGEKIANNKFKLSSTWSMSSTSAYSGTGIRVSDNTADINNGNVLIWRGTGNNNYFSQPLIGIESNTEYKISVYQFTGANAGALFNIGLGNAAGDHSICSVQERLGAPNNKNTISGLHTMYITTPEELGSDLFFTFRNTNPSTTDKNGQNDALTQIDWISLVKCDGSIVGASNAKVLEGAAYAPAGVKEAKAVLQSKIFEATTITTNVTNVGIGAFQIPTSAVEILNKAIEEAQNAYNNASTVADVESATNNLNEAITAYKNTELNAPAENTRYTLTLTDEKFTHKNKAATFIVNGQSEAQGLYGVQYYAPANDNYNQSVEFIPVKDETNQYYLKFTDNDGRDRYICDGSVTGAGTGVYGIRTTAEATKALPIKVIASDIQGVNYLWNTKANQYLGSNGDSGLYTDPKYTHFSIVEAEKATVAVSLAAGKYATRIFPFILQTLPEGVKAYTFGGVEEGNVITLNPVEKPTANVPYILENTSSNEVDITLSGYGLAKQDVYTADGLTGSFAESTDVPAGKYVLQTQDNVQKFYLVGEETATVKMPAYRAYLTIDNAAGVKAFSFGGETTGINGVETLTDGAVESIYTINGTRVNSLQKGLNIVKMSNGKTQKVLVK